MATAGRRVLTEEQAAAKERAAAAIGKAQAEYDHAYQNLDRVLLAAREAGLSYAAIVGQRSAQRVRDSPLRNLVSSGCCRCRHRRGRRCP